LLNLIKRSFSEALFLSSLKSKTVYQIYVCVLFSALLQGALPNFEKYLPPFVLETRRLVIPGHEHAFNPSVIRWGDHMLLTFREISYVLPELPSAAVSNLYVVRINHDFELIGEPQVLELTDHNSISRVEDGRLVFTGGKLRLVYSDNKNNSLREGGYRMYIADLIEKNGQFTVGHHECLTEFDGVSPYRREKNWVPFDFFGYFLMSYSLSPHKVLYPQLDGSGSCITYALTHPSIVWEWGELRGGTPALPLDDQYYLSFFHSCDWMPSVHSYGQCTLHYFFGAYLFERMPPFQIKKISPEPIVGPNYYSGYDYEPYWKPVNVVFPCGFVMDDQYIWVTYGRQDHELWVTKIDRHGLLKSLIHVNNVYRD
jgi:predicted GH43/DUF377 family glycosyl hydrolase